MKVTDLQLEFLKQAVNEAAESGSVCGHRRSEQAKERPARSLKRKRAASTRVGDVDFADHSRLELESVSPSVQVQYRAPIESFLKAFPLSHPKECGVGDTLIAAWAFSSQLLRSRGRDPYLEPLRL